MAGANRDVLGAVNPEHVAVAKATAAESTKAAIFLDGANGQNYKQPKDNLENKKAHTNT